MTGPSDPASTFLHNVVPWATNSYVNIEALEWDPGTKTLKPKASRAARDLKEALSFARWCDSKGWEVYLRMASYKNPGVGKADKRGQTNYRAMSGASNAAMIRGFHIDVDVKPGAHNSTAEAQQAVGAMCAAIGLPLPSLAAYSGGGGFHGHWVLPVPITPAVWLPLAQKLAAACRAHGVHADHNLTVNPVCLLRIPGTHNRKYGQPRVVTLVTLGAQVDIATIELALASFQAAPGNPGVATPGRPVSFVVDPAVFPDQGPVVPGQQFLDGISVTNFTLEEVAEGCPLIKSTLETGGKGQREPLWFAVGHVAVFTEKGEKDFHRLSEKHDSYSFSDTEAKYARIIESKQADDLGWPRCQTMLNAGSTHCAACPKLAQNKSPLNFAVRARATVTPQGNVDSGDNTPLDLTTISVPGYLDDPVSGIYKHPATEEKPETPVWSYPMWNMTFREDTLGRFALHFMTRRSKLGIIPVAVPTANLVDVQQMRRCLVDKYGFGILSTEQRGLLDFMSAFKSQLRDSLDTVPRQDLMGWCEEDGKPSAFIYGPTRYNCAGNTPFNQPEPFIRENYFPVGKIDPWLAAVRMINAEKRPEMDILVATAFAAPLMKFATEKGVVVSAYSSGSAHHKTSAILVAQAVWGAHSAILKLGDTFNNVIARVGTLRVMPSYFDEMKGSNEVKDFAGMVYQISGGRGKGRLNRNAEIRSVQTWETLLVGVSNDSLADAVAAHDKTTEAGINRVFEFVVSPPDPRHGQISTADAGAILKKLEGNYGHAGAVYAAHLGKSVDDLPQIMLDMSKFLETSLNAKNDERFWVSAAAAILVGAQIANSLNLTRFDIGAMSNFIAQTFTNMRANRARSGVNINTSDNIYNILASFVNSNRRAILATDTVGLAGRVGNQNPVTILNHEDVRYSTHLDIRYIEDVRSLRLSRRAFNQWLIKQEVNSSMVIREVVDRYGAKEIRSSIGTGTDLKGAVERLIELDLNHPDLGGLFVTYV